MAPQFPLDGVMPLLQCSAKLIEGFTQICFRFRAQLLAVAIARLDSGTCQFLHEGFDRQNFINAATIGTDSIKSLFFECIVSG